MRKYPEKSEIAVFRDLCAFLSKVQRQLHKDYRKDRFLKYRLVLATDIPHVSPALKEKVPDTSHEATQRIAALLSGEPNSAGAYFVENEEEDQALYGLGKRIKGQAQRLIGDFRSQKGRQTRQQNWRGSQGVWPW